MELRLIPYCAEADTWHGAIYLSMQEVFYSFLSSDFQPLKFITHDFPLQQLKELEVFFVFFENLGFKTSVAKDC